MPLIHCISDYTLSLAMPDFSRTLLQFIDIMNLMSATNVSMHTSMPKEDILAFTATQEYTPIKFIWLILSLIMQNGGIVLDMCQESGRQYSRASTSAVNNLRLRDQRHVVAVDYMTFDTLTLRSDVVVRR